MGYAKGAVIKNRKIGPKRSSMVGNKELRINDGMRGIWTLFAFELFSYTDISCLKGSHVAYCSLFKFLLQLVSKAGQKYGNGSLLNNN